MTVDALPYDQFLGVGSGWAIVCAFVVAILSGRLIPRSTHERELAEKDKQLERADHDAQEWRTEGRIKDQQLQVTNEVVAEQGRQLRHLAEVGETMKSVLAAIKSISLGRQPEEIQ